MHANRHGRQDDDDDDRLKLVIDGDKYYQATSAVRVDANDNNKGWRREARAQAHLSPPSLPLAADSGHSDTSSKLEKSEWKHSLRNVWLLASDGGSYSGGVGGAGCVGGCVQRDISQCTCEKLHGAQGLLPHIRSNQRRFKEAKMKMGSGAEKYANIRFVGFLLFIAASIFCLYKIYELNTSDESTNHFPATYSTKLKLVSVFGRHGDRAPSDALPAADKHRAKAAALWPNGLSNLTSTGRLRQFRIGLELRKRYAKLLDYDASHFLALSSPIYRCQESVLETLRGLFDIETTVSRGRKLVERYNWEQGNGDKFCFRGDDLVHNETFCSEQEVGKTSGGGGGGGGGGANGGKAEKSKLILPGGPGFPLEYKKVKLDTKVVPTLTWQYLNECKWRRERPSPVDANLMNSSAVAKLKGVGKLIKLLKSRYNLDFNFTALGQWSSISNEILLARTRDTIGLSEHYLDWLNTALPEYRKLRVSLYDLWEQVAVFAYRDRIVDTANYIQYGPIITSLVRSQSVALAGHGHPAAPAASSASSNAPSPAPNASGSSSSDTAAAASVGIANKTMEGEQKLVDDPSMAGSFVDGEMYRDKKMILYSTHDSILQQLLMNLSLIRFEPEDFETRLVKWHKSDDISQFLAGYKMSKFGLSIAFELYETELNKDKKGSTSKPEVTETSIESSGGKKFPFIQAVFYNQEDGKYKPIEYRRLKFGAACQRKFRSLHQSLPRSQVDAKLAAYYDSEFPLDRDLSCPFELFKRITSDYMIQPVELNKLCDN